MPEASPLKGSYDSLPAGFIQSGLNIPHILRSCSNFAMSSINFDRVPDSVTRLYTGYWKTGTLPALLICALVLLWTARLLWTGYGSDLRTIPGPFAAKFTRLYLFRQTLMGNAHTFYPDLHRQYGKIVRVAPNKVSISDAETIPAIYGISSKYYKVTSFPISPTTAEW